MKIMAGDTIIKPPAVMALHAVPLPAFADQRLIDVVSELANRHDMPLPLDGPSGLNRATVNLDGLMNYADSPSRGIVSYGQLFRSGAIEGVSQLSREKDGKIYFVGTKIANTVIAALRNYLGVMHALDVGFPVFAALSLCGAAGLHMRHVGPDGLWYDAPALSDDVIQFPEIAIESPDADVTALMRPIFNMMWNGYGFLQSEMYAADSAWKGT
jgi:hypothetical protein